MSTGEKPLNPVAAWRFTMLVPDVRTPALRQVLFDWLRKLRLAMGSITDASRMSVRSRYLSEPKGPFLNAKKNDSAAINNDFFFPPAAFIQSLGSKRSRGVRRKFVWEQRGANGISALGVTEQVDLTGARSLYGLFPCLTSPR